MKDRSIRFDWIRARGRRFDWVRARGRALFAAEVTDVSLALKCLKSWRQLPLHVYIILPIVYIVIRVIIPYMLQKGNVNGVPIVLLIALCAQLIPKGYHAIYHFDRVQKYNRFVFGTLRWNLASKLFRYLLLSHGPVGIFLQ